MKHLSFLHILQMIHAGEADLEHRLWAAITKFLAEGEQFISGHARMEAHLLDVLLYCRQFVVVASL